MTRGKLRLTAASLTLAGIVVFPLGASATAIFSASAEAVLTVIGVSSLSPGGDPAGLSLSAITDVVERETRATGSATAQAFGYATEDAPSSALVKLSQSSSVTGSASTKGVAGALLFTQGLVNIDNASAIDAYEVHFQLSIEDFAAMVSVDDEEREQAFAQAFIEVFVESGRFELTKALTAMPGITGGIGDDEAVFFSLFIPSSGSDAVLFYVDTGGEAIAAPEPPTLFLLLPGLALSALVTLAFAPAKMAR